MAYIILIMVHRYVKYLDILAKYNLCLHLLYFITWKNPGWIQIKVGTWIIVMTIVISTRSVINLSTMSLCWSFRERSVFVFFCFI